MFRFDSNLIGSLGIILAVLAVGLSGMQSISGLSARIDGLSAEVAGLRADVDALEVRVSRLEQFHLEQIAGTVSDRSGSVVAGAMVLASDRQPQLLKSDGTLSRHQVAYTDSTGGYALNTPRTAEYEVLILSQDSSYPSEGAVSARLPEDADPVL